ncbi:MAG: preprotein translocase subunit SecE [Parcubacteria group bacterium CG_4_9_14_0_2_um_filter_35_11]|nr:MAG: preprotein translocase subunit SecE [Parcubacteria group bacterium CG07_land_8_20_14_0_80_35_11]PJC47357.1 MAG: preprotein translocase subunit SecE [Parcubacteria group bacterium CG_4_9_14_0_2_um_filter_35_11]
MRIKNIFHSIKSFFSDVKREIKKVSWPTKKQTLINTLIVIGFSAIIAIYLGGLDAIITWLIGKIIKIR